MTPARTLAPDTRVLVRDDWPERRGPVHVRTPHYLRGIAGRVVGRLGAYPNPEELAFARPAPVIPLYHVLFEASAVWPDAEPGSTLLVELYDHWLEVLP